MFPFYRAQLRFYNRKMHVMQFADGFEINHDHAFHQQIQPVLADFHVVTVKNRRFKLLFNLQSALAQLINQRVLVN